MVFVLNHYFDLVVIENYAHDFLSCISFVNFFAFLGKFHFIFQLNPINFSNILALNLNDCAEIVSYSP